MFSLMRGALGSWLAKIFLGLLVIAFAVWGVSGSMVTGVGSSVVSVGSTSVGLLEYRLAYDRQLQELSRQFGTRLTREQAQALGLEQNVLSQMISGALLDEAGREMGLGVSKDRLAELIGQDEAFRDASGTFSRVQLDQALRSIGMSQEAYIETRRQVAIRSQLLDAVSQAANQPEALLGIISEAETEKRIFEYITLLPGMIPPVSDPTEEELGKWYDENLSRYRAPEYRKLNIVKLEAVDIADEAAVSAESIAEEYEATKARYTVSEKRRVEQLVFASQEAAEAALARIRGGETFDAVAAAEGKSPSDIDLGLLEKSGIPDQTISNAAFGLELNAVSDVVSGVFGPVLLRITEILPESTRPLEEVTPELRKALALEKATEDLFEVHDKLEDERAAGETLAKAAENVGLKMRVVDAVDRNARRPDGSLIEDLPESQKLLEEAFIVDEGIEADPIPIGSDGFVWFEVAGVTPERQKELAEVSEEAKADWRAAQTSQAISELAENIRKKVADGETLEAAIASLVGGDAAKATSAALLRTDTSRDLNAQAVQTGFRIAQGGVAVVNADEDPTTLTVLRVSEVQSGTRGTVQPQLRTRLNDSLGDDIVSGLIARLQDDLTVTVNQQAINAALAN